MKKMSQKIRKADPRKLKSMLDAFSGKSSFLNNTKDLFSKK